MIIGVVGDTHNRISNVEKIIDIFNKSEVECVFHTGDITQAKTLRRFSRLECPLYVVYGNNDLYEEGLKETAEELNFFLEEPPLKINKYGKQILMFHEPDQIEDFLGNETEVDLIIHGHTHKFREEIFKGTKIFNPGECAGSIQGSNAVGIIDLTDLKSKRIFF